MPLKCMSCGVSLIGQEDFVKFPCPACGKGVVVRDKLCRLQSVPYKCPSCGFEGP
ncbi:MAG: zinc finger domain-containing protein [Candidatus Aenigmatarchaeota archaeon]